MESAMIGNDEDQVDVPDTGTMKNQVEEEEEGQENWAGGMEKSEMSVS